MSGGLDRLGATGGSLAVTALNAVIGVVSARLLGPGERSELVLVLAIAGVVALVGTLGTSTAYRGLRPVAEPGLGSSYAALSLLLAVTSGVIAGLVLAASGHAHDPVLLGCAVAYTGALVLQRQAVEAWLAAGNALRAALQSGVAAALGLAGILGVVPQVADASAAVAVLTAATALGVVGDWPHLQARVLGRPRLDTASARRLLGDGVRGLGYVVGTGVAFRADRLLLGGLVLDARALGLYAAAQSLAELTRVLTATAGQLAFRDVAALRQDPATAWRRAMPALGVAILVSGSIAWCAEPLVLLLFGPDYGEAAHLVPLLLVAEALLMPFLVDGRILMALRLPWAATVAGIVGATTAVGVGLLLVPSAGAVGAAWSVCVAYAAMSSTAVVLRGRSGVAAPLPARARPDVLQTVGASAAT